MTKKMTCLGYLKEKKRLVLHYCEITHVTVIIHYQQQWQGVLMFKQIPFPPQHTASNDVVDISCVGVG
jgi:hypothetical protein